MYTASYIKYPLKFINPAGTSRGILRKKDSWFIKLTDVVYPSVTGIGECSHIPGLSIDDVDDFEVKLDHICKLINLGEFPIDQSLPGTPSIQFGLETALKDLNNGGNKILYPSDFTGGKRGIPINGLIWMDEKRSMLNQITAKIDAGFRILKMKVGALKFKDELEILHTIRTRFDRPDLEIRLDANGAWNPDEAQEKIDRLLEYHIHSIEQPIKSGQLDDMAQICEISPVDIALDEELIGVSERSDKKRLLESIKPAYIILKPGLLGGIRAAEEWIELADDLEIGWWITSALESNIGLSAISQWTATLETSLPQGLGTGTLFSNNIPSPLKTIGDKLWYRPNDGWELSYIL